VSFTLPNLEELEEPPTPPTEREGERLTPAGHETPGRRRTVLVVEDDPASRYGLKSLLESEGYRVVEAASLAQADEVARGSRPDAVILDITLPDGDGAEWIRLQQKKGPLRYPVLALTGITADEDRRRIEESGVHAVFQKPVNIPLLLNALEDCLTSKASSS
jgi:CheY-like chemotaxis protein